MKKIILTFVLLLSVICGAMAQNDAMYVYRNDGIINAFLKADVDSMRYSQLDLDSVLHNNYVVQEVWAVDSVYRIPLEKIDSVSFDTPPTVYKKDARVIDDEMLNYITGVDFLTLFFKLDTPKELVPSLNDKLIFMDVTDVLPHGFMGQVADVQYGSESIVVTCNALSITDVLEQYYSFYNVGQSLQAKSGSGAKVTKTWGPSTYSPTPSRDVLTPFISPDIYPDPSGDFSFNVTPRFEHEIAPTYTGSAFLIVSPVYGVTFNLSISEEYKTTTIFNLSGKVDLTRDFRGIQIPVPLPIPLVEIYGEFGAFVRAEASGSFTHEHTQTLRSTLNVEISSRNLFVPKISYNNIDLPSTNKTELMINGSAGVGLYAELGLQFLDKNIANMGFRGEAGIKLGGNAVLYKKDSEKAFHSTEVYNNLLNTDVNLSWFYSVGSQAKFMWVGASHNFDCLTNEGVIFKACPVPSFQETKIEREQDVPTTLFASTKVSGYTLPVDLGFTLFEGDSNEGVSEHGSTSYNAYGYMGPQTELYSSFYNMKSTGGYTIYPTVKLWGIEMLAEPSAELPTHSCPDNNHPHAIDLGLPSGTKWCCMNVGATSPEGYGGYYAWGETNEKSVYNEDSYLYYDKNKYKYVSIGSDIAGTSYDVAHVRMGGSWRMPSVEQQDELVRYCTSTWTQQNGVHGRLMTGVNGGQIFLPAAGYRRDSSLWRDGSYCGYWLSSPHGSGSYDACVLGFGSSNVRNYNYRDKGLSVRAVCP